MVRFIFVCMGIVALSVIAIASQSARDGISSAQQVIAARNAPEPTPVMSQQDETSPDNLNNIATAAGDVSYDPADTFTGGFTNAAPKALGDEPQAPALNTMGVTQDSQTPSN